MRLSNIRDFLGWPSPSASGISHGSSAVTSTTRQPMSHLPSQPVLFHSRQLVIYAHGNRRLAGRLKAVLAKQLYNVSRLHGAAAKRVSQCPPQSGPIHRRRGFLGPSGRADPLTS